MQSEWSAVKNPYVTWIFLKTLQKSSTDKCIGVNQTQDLHNCQQVINREYDLNQLYIV